MKVFLSDTQKQLLILLFKYENGLERSAICEILGIPSTTAYDNLKKLEKLKVIKRHHKLPNGRGRPQVVWRLKKGKAWEGAS